LTWPVAVNTVLALPRSLWQISLLSVTQSHTTIQQSALFRVLYVLNLPLRELATRHFTPL